MGDWRKQGHAIRRREGAPSSHIGGSRLIVPPSYVGGPVPSDSGPTPGGLSKDVPDAAIYPSSEEGQQ